MPLFNPWGLLSGDVFIYLTCCYLLLFASIVLFFNCISCSDFMLFFTIWNLWAIRDVVWCRCSMEQSNYCCKTQVLAVSIKLWFLHSNVNFNGICGKLFNSLPLWIPNNLITKIQVIVLKIRTLILISCQETGCDCVDYATLMKKLQSFQTLAIVLILTIVRAGNYQRTSSITHNSNSTRSRPFATNK